ncbi:MAG: hypothetical protein A4S09_00790 [Proteobacteria bacterium SG_bin7]|nr:MAG: hypothetical protein A4S09_00790 [Proteobacteria bacterium SG_bin7]
MAPPLQSQLAMNFGTLVFLFVTIVFSLPSLAEEIKEWDQPEILGEGDEFIRSLEEMDLRDLRSGSVFQEPWSGYLWPMDKMGPLQRYNDKKFPITATVQSYFSYLEQNPPTKYFSEGAEAINKLSPLEKFELLTLDMNFPMTKSALGLLKSKTFNDGTIPSWYGFCDGLAAASIIFPRPKHSINVTAIDKKTKIHFLPEDLKAIATYYMSSFGMRNRLEVGAQCRTQQPKRGSTGRPEPYECNDINPASFHMAVVNRVGLHRRHLILEADAGYPEWNHPIINYKYEFFNPVTKSITRLKKAGVAPEEYSKDPFKSVRSTNTAKIVGVHMKILKSDFHSAADDVETDSPERDSRITIIYDCTLELDKQGQIIGGEWDNPLDDRARPDFIWALPTKNFKPANSPQEFALYNRIESLFALANE